MTENIEFAKFFTELLKIAVISNTHMNSNESLAVQIKKIICQRTNHLFTAITTRGDAAIKAALAFLPKDKTLLIPQEGGWLSYPKIPKEKNIPFLEVSCLDAKIDLLDLKEKLMKNSCSALLYQNPGGYFAQQPMREIYQLCQKYDCLVILDASGSIGTELCDGRFADIIIGSFGEWKLVEAGKGGFISCMDKKIFNSLILTELDDTAALTTIKENLDLLDQRIDFLKQQREKIMNDLNTFSILYPKDLGFVVVVAFSSPEEKEKIINYCQKNALEWTECPRYIRVQRPGISIEIKRLQQDKENINKDKN